MNILGTTYRKVVGIAFATILTTSAQGQWITERVSVDSNGSQSQLGDSQGGHLSADNRYVCFDSYADNLVPGDTNGVQDCFVKDRLTGAITRVSVSSSGEQGNFQSDSPTISADGRYVAFNSRASNLVIGDTMGGPDAFVHDQLTGETTRVSISSTGVENNGGCFETTISPNGRYVAFASAASTLVEGAGGGNIFIFVHDRQTGLLTCVSRSSSGELANFPCRAPLFSADGRYVAFSSEANNLVAGDTNLIGGWDASWDVFVHDQQTGITKRVSVSSNGDQGDSGSKVASLSADGTIIGFVSKATNLVAGDTNGVDDIFLHNTITGVTTRVSVSTTGIQGDGDCRGGFMSGDGRYIGFDSDSTNLDPRDRDSGTDVFLHDSRTGITKLISVSTAGIKGNYNSFGGVLSFDGSIVSFASYATNLVPGDTNWRSDVFLYVMQEFDFSLTLNKVTVAGQNSVLGTILFAGSSVSNLSLAIYADSAKVATPSLITVPAGVLSKNFRITVTPVLSPTPVTIFADSGRIVKSQPLILVPLVPTALAFTPRHVTGGESISGRVVINGVAGPNGLVLNLSDNSNFVTTPPTVTVPPGGTQAIFTMTTATVTSYKYVIVTAQVPAGSRTGMFRLNP